MTQGPKTPYSYDMRGLQLYEVIDAATRGLELGLRVCFPATVSSVEEDGARVKVVPDIQNVLATDTGEDIVQQVEIFNIPVWSDGQGAIGGGYLQFPVRVGDKGWVHVNDRSIDGWYENGLPAPPAGYHAHNMIDGYFVNGARDKTRALAQDPTAVVLEHESIKLGAGATPALKAARATDATAAATSMATWITAVIAGFAALPVPITIPPPTDFGTITGGSTKTTIE